MEDYIRSKLKSIDEKLDNHGDKLEEIRILQAKQNGKVNQNCKEIEQIWRSLATTNTKSWGILQAFIICIMTIILTKVIL